MRIFSSKIATGICILICMLLPLLKYNYTASNSFTESLSVASEKFKNDKVGLLEDVWDWGKKKLFDTEEKIVPKTNFEKVTHFIYTGYSFGISSIGALKDTLYNVKFKLLGTKLLSASIVFFLLCIQFLFNLKKSLRQRYFGVLSLLCLLCLVVIIGSSNDTSNTIALLKGCLPFLILQSYLMLAAAKCAKQNNLNFPIMKVGRK